jgi:signal peptidase I
MSDPLAPTAPAQSPKKSSRWSKWVAPVAILFMLLLAFRPRTADIEGPSMAPAVPGGTTVLLAPRWLRAVRLGDIVVARSPNDPTMIVKRVVGVAGDRIAWEPGGLVRNGARVVYALGPTFEWNDLDGVMTMQCAHERLGAQTFWTIEDASVAPFVKAAVRVPPGQVYVAGDHRDRSNDSRYWGTLPLSSIVGVVVHVFGEPPKPCR